MSTRTRFEEEANGNSEMAYWKTENKQTQPTYNNNSGNRTQATLEGSKGSRHYASTAKWLKFPFALQMKDLLLRHRVIIRTSN